jgi:hypothetical protein
VFTQWVSDKLKTKHKNGLPEFYSQFQCGEEAGKGFVLPEAANIVSTDDQNYCGGIIKSHHLGDLMAGLSGLANVAINKLTKLVFEQIQKKRKVINKVKLLRRLNKSFEVRNSLGFNTALNPKDLRLLQVTHSESLGSGSELRKNPLTITSRHNTKVSNFESLKTDLTSLDSVSKGEIGASLL